MAELQSSDPAATFAPGGAASIGSDDRADRRLLQTYLADRDVACPRCRYNLRTLSGDRCTECGTQIVLGIHAVEPILRAWVTATIAASLGAGIGLLFMTIVLAGNGMPPDRWLWIVLTSWACIPTTIGLAARRRTFVKSANVLQWLIAFVMIAIVVVLIAGLTTVR